MDTFWLILAWSFFGLCLIFFIYVMRKHKDSFQPFPQKIKFRIALKWWLSAGWRTYDKHGRRKYCSECGWKLVYIDDLYDEMYIRESVNPDTVAVCSFCGVEFVEFESWSTNRKAVLRKID